MENLVADLILRAKGSKEISAICGRTVAAVERGDVCYRLNEQELELVKGADLMGLFKLHDRLPLLYTMRNWKYERLVIGRVKAMLEAQVERITLREDDERLSHLKKRQREAVEQMVGKQISIMTGGPGTGKTYTLARAVMVAKDGHPDLRVRLAAPTGKAAARMSESIGKELGDGYKATTIHQMLGSNRDFVTFKHNRKNPLECDWLIVDEASMIDLPMMAKLLDALPPGCRLTLVGDENQLPSVERGSVFADLCHLAGFPCVRLDESLRFEQGGSIFNLSEAVNTQDAVRVRQLLATDNDRVSYVRLDGKTAFEPSKWPGFMAQVKERFSAFLQAETAADALTHLDDFRVLCAFRIGPYGVEALNEYLLKELAGSLRKPSTPVPMMVTRNDHAMNLANGDVGVVMPEEPEYLQLKGADDKVRKVRIELLASKEYAFASTIHKSQGSEFEEVAIVIPPDMQTESLADGEQSILTKEILYTGITRGKKHVRIYADNESLARCCTHAVKRNSGLRIAGRGNDSTTEL